MKSRTVVKDKGWKDILAAAQKTARGARVKVGILGDNARGGLHAVDPATGKAADLTIAEVAVVNEFGTEDGSVPARAAHRLTFDRRREEIEREAADALVAVTIDRKITAEQALNAMGMRHAAAIRSTITDGAGAPPPNAPSTAARKEAAGEWNKGGLAQAAGQGARPLVDTGVTINAISWAVEVEKKQQPPQYLGGAKEGP